MKNLLLFPVGAVCTLLLGCQIFPSSSPGEVSFNVQPKTSKYYTSDSSGSNGPAFQLVTVSNSQNNIVDIKSISLAATSSSISIAARNAPLNQYDALYGNLPQCSTGKGKAVKNELSPHQSCGILLQGVTYDPRKATQTGHLKIEVFSNQNNSNIVKTFNLTNTTHVYASPNQNSLGTENVAADKYILADCSNNSNKALQPLTCTNALGANASSNFLSNQASQIKVFPNGNIILGGKINQAGNFSAISPTASVVLICKPGSNQCENALAAGTYFGLQAAVSGASMGNVTEIELNANTNNSTFFVTGKFENIKNETNVIAHGTGIYPYFVAYCTIGGSCTNIMPNESVSSPAPADNGIYGLAFSPTTNNIYFAGNFKSFTKINSSGTDFPVVSCKLNSNNYISSCSNYFDSSALNSQGPIFGLNFLNDTKQIQINTDSTSIGGQTTPPQNNDSRLSAVCTHTSCSANVSTASGITARGSYDSHAQTDAYGHPQGGLLYISGNYTSIGNASSNSDQKIFLAACKKNNIQDCFDVLGGGINGEFNNGNYPTTAGALGIIADVGANLVVTPN